jgi:hypothetical protein
MNSFIGEDEIVCSRFPAVNSDGKRQLFMTGLLAPRKTRLGYTLASGGIACSKPPKVLC